MQFYGMGMGQGAKSFGFACAWGILFQFVCWLRGQLWRRGTVSRFHHQLKINLALGFNHFHQQGKLHRCGLEHVCGMGAKQRGEGYPLF